MRAVIFLVSIVAATSGDAVGAAPNLTVSVRTYNYAGVPTEELAGARAEAERIFDKAHIWVEWKDCRVPGRTEGAACTEPMLTGSDLLLRLVERTAPGGERIVALGESMLDREQRGGVLMTVDLFPVRTVAARASTSVPALLGRAIAHEIGHLLLASGQHPRVGLMRALWSQDELRGLKPADWGFSSREAARMRQTLRGTSRTAD